MIDIEKTRQYYNNLSSKDLCDCKYCVNYMNRIKDSYPLIAQYLESIGVDIEKPFETMCLNPGEANHIDYFGPQYIVMGNTDNFKEVQIDDIHIRKAESFPYTDILDEHFVIELYPIISLKWN